MDKKRKTGIGTRLIHSGNEFNKSGAIVPPIVHSVNFEETSVEKLAKTASAYRPLRFYTRYNHPLAEQIASIVSSLEKTEDALVLGSGMAAISTAIISSVKSGDHIVAQTSLYAGSLKLMRDILPHYGIETTFVDSTKNKDFEKAVRKNTKLIYVETPANPLMRITDLKFIGKLAKKHKLISIIDNTFATPINQTPADFGIDVITHSATKYLCGHSDAACGVICGSKKFIERAWEYSHIVGYTISPFDASLLLRGLRTLSVRVKRQNESAKAIANFLNKHKKVKEVFYPGLKSFPQHKLAKSQMKDFGGVFSFELKAGYNATKKFAELLKLCKLAVSLGGVETIISHPAAQWKPYYSEKQLKQVGIPLSLLRLSVGLEDVKDIINDLGQTLKKI